jgi:branched-chain amino acid aminotransferase
VSECFGKYLILNGDLRPAAEFDNSMVYEGESYYEVIRVIRGLPLFFTDHINRLHSSVSLAGQPQISDMNIIRNKILELSRAEKMEEVNLKIVFNFNQARSIYLIYYIEPFYPTADQYLHGVKGILFPAERKDPEVKIIDNQLRSAIKHKLALEKGYEALLVNRNGCITEGSRSNIFFITGNRLVTAPENCVLGGITRKHLIDICRENWITLEYNCVNIDELSDYESVIMTGTSPVVLPFYSIDDILFNVKHPLIGHLRTLFIDRMEDSLKDFAGCLPPNA